METCLNDAKLDGGMTLISIFSSKYLKYAKVQAVSIDGVLA
jgi:hypothetical protein